MFDLQSGIIKKIFGGGSDLGATYTEDSLLKITLSTI